MMIKTKTIIIWSLAGIVFSILSFYLADKMTLASYYGQTESYKTSTALFLSGVLQLFFGFLLMKPIRKTYHVPPGQVEYRDPFVGLDREELADHGYGTENKDENNKRKLQGFIFAMPGIVSIAISLYIGS